MSKAIVTLHQRDQFERVVACLTKRVGIGDMAAFDTKVHTVAIGRDQRARFPVFDLQQQHAPSRMQHYEIWLTSLRSDRYVVPDKTVVTQAALKLPQHFSFASITPAINVCNALGKNCQSVAPLHAD